MGKRLDLLDEPILIAVPLLTEFGIHHRLEICDPQLASKIPAATKIHRVNHFLESGICMKRKEKKILQNGKKYVIGFGKLRPCNQRIVNSDFKFLQFKRHDFLHLKFFKFLFCRLLNELHRHLTCAF